MNETAELAKSIPVKLLLSILPGLVFIYFNGVMLYALMSKHYFRESPRYMLFAHLLYTDSLQLVASLTLYLFAAAKVRVIFSVCTAVTLLAIACVKISPLNLAVMSLERYIAIRFPLRHANIATTKRTMVAITVVWTVISFDSLTQCLLFVSHEKEVLPLSPVTCHKNSIFRLQTRSIVNVTFISIYFVMVGFIIIFTYVAVLITVKIASSEVENAHKAHRTLLLHFFQLCLCLLSLLFNMVEPESHWSVDTTASSHVQYILFLSLIIFPKFLSPFLYGLRDNTLRQVFKFYLTFGLMSTAEPQSKT